MTARNSRRGILATCACLIFVFEFQNSAIAQSNAQEQNALSCLESTCRNIPNREKLTAVGHGYVRGVVGGFEQGAGIDGGAQFTTNNKIPGITARMNLLTSTRFDRRVDFETFIPAVGSSKNHADAWFSYMRRNTNFFGIGPRMPRDFKTDFGTELRSVQASFSRDLTPFLQVGVYAQFVDTNTFRGRNKTDPPIDASFTTDRTGPVSQWAPGLFENTQIASAGGFLLYDRRDNESGLTRGVQLYGRAATYDGLPNHGAFADYGWNEAEVDLRAYIPVGGDRTSIALRSRGQLKHPKRGSQIPFYDLSWLGGRNFVRGFETYRYRANNILMGSVELRQTIYANSPIRGFDLIGFVDTGQVWGDNRSTTDPTVLENRHFSRSNWRTGIGGGVQYRRSRNIAARLEVGRTNETTLIYVSLTRGF